MESPKESTSISYFMNTKNWWAPLTFILIISLLGVGLIGLQTYIDAPPWLALLMLPVKSNYRQSFHDSGSGSIS